MSAQKSNSVIEERQEATKGSRNGAVASLSGVTRKYGSVTALKQVSLEVRTGELLAVLGPNGAGKTTSVRLLLGLSRPDAGQARVFGGDPSQHATRFRVGAMLQVAKVPETLKVKEHINQFRGYYPNPLAYADVIRSAGLDGLEDRLFGALSGGQKQRVLFALAICGNPDLVFLDEPTVGLDVGTRHLIWQQIRELVQQRRTVVLTTHYLEEVDALADRVIVLNQGVIVAEGSSAEIKARTAQKKIRCTTRLSPEEIAGIAGVCGVTRHETRIELRTTDAESVLRELLARDPGLSGLELSSGSLEDAFLKILETSAQEKAQEMTA